MGYHPARLAVCLAVSAAIATSTSCTGHESRGKAIEATLAFRVDAALGLTAARDISVDTSGNVLLFDYGDYVIRSFAPDGALITEFGGKGESPGLFEHLMAVRARNDRILALDSAGLSTFEPSGTLITHQAFSEQVVCDLPRIGANGIWCGEWILGASAEKTLTCRDAEGREVARPASYPLSEFFPGIEPGGFFFIKGIQARNYLYDYLADDRMIWAASDDLRIFVRGRDTDDVLYEAHATPLEYPPAEVARLREAQAGLEAPLYSNVPECYQFIQQLCVDERGDLWLHLTTAERNGLLHLSASGEERGFHEFDVPFDPLEARMTAACGKLYFLLPGPETAEVFTAIRP